MPPDEPSDFTLAPVDYDPFVAAAPSSGNLMDAVPARPNESLPEFWQRWNGAVSALKRQGRAAAPAETADNFAEAKTRLDLTPQEQALYQRHVDNLAGPGGVTNPDGSRSTLYQAVVEHDGMFYSVPTVWDGVILAPDQAAKRVAEEGWDKFPKYATPQAADTRYTQMHDYIEKDTAAYFRQKEAAPKPGVTITPVDHNPFAARPMAAIAGSGGMAAPPEQQMTYPIPPARDPNDPMINVDRSLPLPRDRNSIMPDDVMGAHFNGPPPRDI